MMGAGDAVRMERPLHAIRVALRPRRTGRADLRKDRTSKVDFCAGERFMLSDVWYVVVWCAQGSTAVMLVKKLAGGQDRSRNRDRVEGKKFN